MGNGYIKPNNNVYFKARKEASKWNENLYSREGASDLLGISVSTLADYELGVTKIVPVDKVVLMADLYNCPELKNQYCKKECPIGRSRSIAVLAGNIESVALKLLNACDEDKLNFLKKAIIKIASDGEVKKEELPELSEIIKIINLVQLVLSELQLINEKILGRVEVNGETRNNN